MTGKPTRSAADGGSGLLGYGLIVVAAALAWETVKVPLLTRAPDRIASLAATSPDALGLLAEKELAAKRTDNAAALAIESLRRAPFNARSLRVWGLAQVENGDMERADEAITLAGNWSLRDDPAHAWLIERRLRQGNYGSAFAHADTLVRRREDLYPEIFELFTSAASIDNRALPSLTNLVGARPTWRGAYLDFLHRDRRGDPILFALAMNLADRPGRLNAAELENLYGQWLAKGQIGAIKLVRRRETNGAAEELTDGNFELEEKDATLPFTWRLGQMAGLSTQITNSSDGQNKALFAYAQGMDPGIVTDQLILLSPGQYRLTHRYRSEAGNMQNRVSWRIRCIEGLTLDFSGSTPFKSDQSWNNFASSFVVPSGNCAAQYIELRLSPTDRRSLTSFWVDDVAVNAVQPKTT